jgi:hypothetical protein
VVVRTLTARRLSLLPWPRRPWREPRARLHEPLGEGCRRAEVGGVAVQEDGDAAFAAVGQSGVVKDPALRSVEVRHGGSCFQQGS